jgi:hypothetical protein
VLGPWESNLSFKTAGELHLQGKQLRGVLPGAR